jgi:hypothetical protein
MIACTLISIVGEGTVAGNVGKRVVAATHVYAAWRTVKEASRIMKQPNQVILDAARADIHHARVARVSKSTQLTARGLGGTLGAVGTLRDSRAWTTLQELPSPSHNASLFRVLQTEIDDARVTSRTICWSPAPVRSDFPSEPRN